MDNLPTLHAVIIHCSECDNTFYVNSRSEEFRPKFCCYCGVEFTGLHRPEQPQAMSWAGEIGKEDEQEQRVTIEDTLGKTYEIPISFVIDVQHLERGDYILFKLYSSIIVSVHVTRKEAFRVEEIVREYKRHG